MIDYYQTLEVESNASQTQIKNQYRFLVQAWHPDKFGSPESKAKAEEKLKQINEAYNTLKDPAKRNQYDNQRKYSQKGNDNQAKNEYENQRREQEKKTKTDQGKQAESNKYKQKEEAKRGSDAKSIGIWFWVLFAIVFVGLIARGFSALSPVALVVTETFSRVPASTIKVPVIIDPTVTTEILSPTILPESVCSSPIEWNAQNIMLGVPPTRIGRLDGDGWSANVNQDQLGYLQYGPYTTEVDVGDHIVSWALMIDDNSYDDLSVVRLEVSDYTTGATILVSRDITRREWSKTFKHECFYLPFNLNSSQLQHVLEFRVFWYGTAYVHLAKVGLK